MATETNTNTNQKVVKQIEEGNDIREKVKTLEKQNMHLIGESTILRQNLVTLEKENYKLKEKQNSNYIEGFRKNEDVKKELKILQIENKIKENQLKAFKRPRNIVIGDLKPSWIFNRISADIKFCLYPFEHSRLKILHDYFYDEFEKLLGDANIVQEVCRYRSNFKLFYKFFMMFSDKKELFDEMFIMLFIDFFDAESEKNTNYLYKVLYKCNLSWILNFLDDKDFMNLLNNFLYKSTHTSACLLFYCKIAKERPFLLNIFLPKSRFHQLLVHKHSHINYLLDIIDDETLEKYIDNNAIEYMDRKYLLRVFKNDYFE